MANAVQKLYEVCKATFCRREDLLSSLAIQPVRSQLDCMKPCDVGLDDKFFDQLDQGFGFFGTRNGRKGWYSPVARWSPPITYLHIYECDDFSMGIFCLPTSASIPLHNHPGMTVLSKLLYGSMHVKAYDWIDTFVEVDRLQSRLAKLEVDGVMSAPCETTVLYATTGGNIHQFTAVTSCAVLDVLAPPYSTLDGRDCTYYRDFPYLSHSDGLFDNQNVDGSEHGLALLEEFQPPDDFVVKTAPYKGPRIVFSEGL